jgi:hypothetical protein
MFVRLVAIGRLSAKLPAMVYRCPYTTPARTRIAVRV